MGMRKVEYRGLRQINEARVAALLAAERNAHKGDYMRVPIRQLFDKLEEEQYELYEAVLSNDLQRIFEELGDVFWVTTMIGHRTGALTDEHGV